MPVHQRAKTEPSQAPSEEAPPSMLGRLLLLALASAGMVAGIVLDFREGSRQHMGDALVLTSFVGYVVFVFMLVRAARTAGRASTATAPKGITDVR